MVAATALAGPASAAAETVVPPGNGAVNQYTQTFPTPGGKATVEGDSVSSPSRTLGKRQTRELEAEGPEGVAAANLAAETAPVAAGDSGDSGGSGDGSRSGAGSGATGGRADGSGHSVGLDVQGASGLGAVLGGAFGASSGGLGLLMPLLILLALAWCLAYAWRQRRIG